MSGVRPRRGRRGQFSAATRRRKRLHLLGDLAVLSLGRGGVAGADRGQPQIRLQIAQRGGEVLEVIGEQAAIAQLGQRRRIDGEQQLRDEARLRERAHPHVEPLQIHQRAHDDLRARRRLEQPVVELRVAAVLLKQLLAVVSVEDARRRGTDPRSGTRPHRCAGPSAAGTRSRKCPGKFTPFDPQAGAPRDLDVDDRQRDRDAGPAIQHLVEEAVARIVVVLAVAR